MFLISELGHVLTFLRLRGWLPSPELLFSGRKLKCRQFDLSAAWPHAFPFSVPFLVLSCKQAVWFSQ